MIQWCANSRSIPIMERDISLGRPAISFSALFRSRMILDISSNVSCILFMVAVLRVGIFIKNGKCVPRIVEIMCKELGGEAAKASNASPIADDLPFVVPKSCAKPARPMLSREMQFILREK